MGLFKKSKHECWMTTVAVTHETINGQVYTHCLKRCKECGDWEVETVAGTWTVDQIEPGE